MWLINRLENLVFRLPVPIVNSNIRAKILRSKGAKIGQYVSINRYSNFGNPNNIEVGDDCVIGANVFMDGWSSIAGRFHSLKLRSIEPVDHQYLGLFLILINQKLRKKAAIALWKRVLGK